MLLTKLSVHDLGHLALVTSCCATLINVIMLLKQSLEVIIRVGVIFCQSKDLEGLLLRDESSLDPESLLGDLLSALIGEFLGM